MSRISQQTFTYSLGEPGTAVAHYTVDGIESEFELSNVCNPLGDMLCAVASMLTNPSQLWEGSNTAAFTWYSESESYNWTLNVAQDGLMTIRVTQSCEFFGDDEVEIANGECDLTDFVNCLVLGLDSFIKQVGLLNYNQQWQTGEFPLTYFLILKRHLIERGLWNEEAKAGDGVLDAEVSMLLS